MNELWEIFDYKKLFCMFSDADEAAIKVLLNHALTNSLMPVVEINTMEELLYHKLDPRVKQWEKTRKTES